MFFNNASITVLRPHSTGLNKYSYSATYTGYDADIQPVPSTRGDSGVGRIGKSYIGYIDASVGVEEGDKIVANGKTYSVKTVTTWAGAGLLDHKVLDLESRD